MWDRLLLGRPPFAKMAAGKILVAESGINCKADVERLQRCGAKAILVGESLMRADNLESKIANPHLVFENPIASRLILRIAKKTLESNCGRGVKAVR